MLILSVNECLDKGLRYVRVELKDWASKGKETEEFKKHYGSTPLALADMWFDLYCTGIPEARLSESEKARGLKMFFVANYFLWNYPRNANNMASRFKMCVNYCKGTHLWSWVKKLQL